MEKPLNIKHRNKAIGRFLFISLLAICLMLYHVLITLDFYNRAPVLMDENQVEIAIPAEE